MDLQGWGWGRRLSQPAAPYVQAMLNPHLTVFGVDLSWSPREASSGNGVGTTWPSTLREGSSGEQGRDEDEALPPLRPYCLLPGQGGLPRENGLLCLFLAPSEASSPGCWGAGHWVTVNERKSRMLLGPG